MDKLAILQLPAENHEEEGTFEEIDKIDKFDDEENISPLLKEIEAKGKETSVSLFK